MNRWHKNFLTVFGVTACAIAQQPAKPVAPQPWMDLSLPIERRVELILAQMTLDEKIALLHGTGQPGFGPLTSEGASNNGGAGYMQGVPRLGIPGVQMADAAYGVTKTARAGRYSTALPSNMALAASWDNDVAEQYGALIGKELRAQGYNMTLGGGVDLARELRNGRNFEYGGEDPILAGVTVGHAMKALQAEHVIGDIKHFALNDQESGRNAVNVSIDERAARESDLLAFQIALRESKAGAVMCSYNRVNGDFACENHHLLTDVLRTDWGFKGFVLSDWGGTHSTLKASAAGLDHEEPNGLFFGEDLKKAVLAKQVPQAEIDEHVRRILHAEVAAGLLEYPVERSVPDAATGLKVARQVAESSMVLLKNANALLPLDRSSTQRIAIIGAHADIAMLSGGGSAQVEPPLGNAILPAGKGQIKWMDHVWFPTSPLRALQAKAPHATFSFDSGEDLQRAATLAKSADIVLVFAQQWESEAMDLPSLSLPDRQDALIEAVAAANPHAIVVLETGSACLMPWIDKVSGVLEAWYAGSSGDEALVNVLFGEVDPSGRLPITFPRSEDDLPHRSIVQPPAASQGQFYGNYEDEQNRKGFPAFQTLYDEGLKVGYKWYEAEKKPVLFPFGFGLSYTTFGYSDLKLEREGKGVRARFVVSNTGKRAGVAVPQLYVALPASSQEPPHRLVGWSKIALAAGERREVSIEVDPLYLSVYDTGAKGFHLVPGEYLFQAGESSSTLSLTRSLTLK